MKVKVDLIFIDVLNKTYGLNLTFNEFKEFYRKVKEVRENDEEYQKKNKRYRAETKAYIEALVSFS